MAWGDPAWRVRDKIFAMQKGNYAGGRPSVWLKGEDGQQAALVDTDPALFFVPPYVGNKGWIGIHLDSKRLDLENDRRPHRGELPPDRSAIRSPPRRSRRVSAPRPPARQVTPLTGERCLRSAIPREPARVAAASVVATTTRKWGEDRDTRCGQGRYFEAVSLRLRHVLLVLSPGSVA